MGQTQCTCRTDPLKCHGTKVFECCAQSASTFTMCMCTSCRPRMIHECLCRFGTTPEERTRLSLICRSQLHDETSPESYGKGCTCKELLATDLSGRVGDLEKCRFLIHRCLCKEAGPERCRATEHKCYCLDQTVKGCHSESHRCTCGTVGGKCLATRNHICVCNRDWLGPKECLALKSNCVCTCKKDPKECRKEYYHQCICLTLGTRLCRLNAVPQYPGYKVYTHKCLCQKTKEGTILAQNQACLATACLIRTLVPPSPKKVDPQPQSRLDQGLGLLFTGCLPSGVAKPKID